MHEAQTNFLVRMKERFPDSFRNSKVLEIGSLDINGTIRVLFENCEYVGVDVGEGPCVDVVCSGHEYDAPDNSFDTVVSSECFEHNPYWKETFANMHRTCKPGGVVMFTCATDGRPEHGTNRTQAWASRLTVAIGWGDYYRNLNSNDFETSFNLSEMFESYEFSVEIFSHDLYFYGVKK